VSGKTVIAILDDPVIDHSCAGCILKALTFYIIIIFLGLWTTAFLLVKDHFFRAPLPGNTLMDLTCVTFFGDLLISIFVGALAGNSL
jgi:hypothetical protein